MTEAELDEAVAYAALDHSELRFKRGKRAGQIKRKAYVGQELDRDLLRILGNTALRRREEDRRVRLPLLAANVVREAVPMFSGTPQEVQLRYEAYKAGVMKVMSIRRVWQAKNDARKRKQGLPVPERPKQTEHPLDPSDKHKNQLRLFS